MPILNSKELREEWKDSHAVIDDMGSKTQALLDMIKQREEAHTSTQAEKDGANRQQREERDAAWAKDAAERRAQAAARAQEREQVWKRKAEEDAEEERQREKYNTEIALRHKRAMLQMQIEMMRREAQHNQHMVSVTGDIEAGTGADTGIEAARAEEWLRISDLPAHRLVIAVFEAIDADDSGTLDFKEILASAYGEKLSPHWAALDPDNDGDVTLSEWVEFFEELKGILAGDYGMFMVDLVWQGHMDTSEMVTITEAVVKIQSRFRGNRWRWEKRMLAQTATRIQSCWRGRRAREKVEFLRSVRAGLRIQSFIRARKARQELRQTNPLLARKLRDSGGNIHSPEEALAAFNQASTMLRKGETSDEMVELYMRAVELGFERRNRCFNGAGMVRCKQDRSREGYEFFSQATAFDQHDSRAWHNRANAAFDLGDIQQAHADAMRARTEASEVPGQMSPSAGSHGPSAVKEISTDSVQAEMLWRAAGVAVPPDPDLSPTKLSRSERKKREAEAEANYAEIADLLDAGADVDYDLDGLTCLGRAAVSGNAEAANMLLSAGAQVELATRQRRYKTCGWTPLMLAAHHGHVEVIKRLLAAGTDLERSTADVLARVRKGDEQTVWTVLDAGASDDVKATLAPFRRAALEGAPGVETG